MVYYCDAAECESHRSKAKMLHIHPFMAVVMWGKISLQSEDGPNLMTKSRLGARHVDKVQISTDGCRSADPVYFAWNNWRKTLSQGRQEKTQISKAPDECERCRPFRSALVVSISFGVIEVWAVMAHFDGFIDWLNQMSGQSMTKNHTCQP